MPFNGIKIFPPHPPTPPHQPQVKLVGVKIILFHFKKTMAFPKSNICTSVKPLLCQKNGSLTFAKQFVLKEYPSQVSNHIGGGGGGCDAHQFPRLLKMVSFILGSSINTAISGTDSTNKLALATRLYVLCACCMPSLRTCGYDSCANLFQPSASPPAIRQCIHSQFLHVAPRRRNDFVPSALSTHCIRVLLPRVLLPHTRT